MMSTTVVPDIELRPVKERGRHSDATIALPVKHSLNGGEKAWRRIVIGCASVDAETNKGARRIEFHQSSENKKGVSTEQFAVRLATDTARAHKCQRNAKMRRDRPCRRFLVRCSGLAVVNMYTSDAKPTPLVEVHAGG
jgi:hypothetical protein